MRSKLPKIDQADCCTFPESFKDARSVFDVMLESDRSILRNDGAGAELFFSPPQIDGNGLGTESGTACSTPVRLTAYYHMHCQQSLKGLL